MPIQVGPDGPSPICRVRWKEWSGTSSWLEVIAPPEAAEGLLILKPAPGRTRWIPLHTITGAIEIEGLPADAP